MDAHAEAIAGPGFAPSLSPRAERAALGGAARGDAAAVALLFRAHWPGAYRAAWMVVRDDHVAEDVAQEGFVAALRALDRFDRSRPFGPWLRTIVTRRAIDAVRARAARPVEVDGTTALALLPSPSSAAAPDADVLAAVAALPDEQRSVVVLRHLLELTPSEIADVVGVPTGTVNSRLRRGLDALAKALTPLLLIVLAATAVAAFTRPGQAAAEWVRDHLSKVTGHAQRVAAPPVRSGGSLPGGGRLLVVNAHGPTVLGRGAAPRVLLGAVDAAAWSPHGRFVAAVRGIELIAVDLRGHRRWHVAGRHPLRTPAWSPSGYRVAYLDGAQLRVVNGDGSGDRALAPARPVAPAWRPGPRHVLAAVTRSGDVVVRDTDTTKILFRARPAHRVTHLAFVGAHLLALSARDLTTYSSAGRRLATAPAPPGTTNVALAVRGRHVALLRRVAATGDHRLLLDDRLVAAGPGRAGPRAVALSPDARWLALDHGPAAPFTLLRAADGTTRALSAGTHARLSGWCCDR